MLRWMKWLGLIAVISLVIACFMPWVTIDSKNIVVKGIDATGTNFGKPGYFHLFMSFFFLIFSFIPKVWAKRTNLLVTALNLGWGIRNFYIISTCSGGECPHKEIGIYIILFASILMLIAALFPDIKLEEEKLPANRSTQ